MMQSMLSSASALRAHKVKMDVIAHNIANVNTNDFKSSSVTLQDSFSQTIEQARAARVDSMESNREIFFFGFFFDFVCFCSWKVNE